MISIQYSEYIAYIMEDKFCVFLFTGALYFWGVAKSSGEATMYPKLVQDLSGWKIRCMGTR